MKIDHLIFMSQQLHEDLGKLDLGVSKSAPEELQRLRKELDAERKHIVAISDILFGMKKELNKYGAEVEGIPLSEEELVEVYGLYVQKSLQLKDEIKLKQQRNILNYLDNRFSSDAAIRLTFLRTSEHPDEVLDSVIAEKNIFFDAKDGVWKKKGNEA